MSEEQLAAVSDEDLLQLVQEVMLESMSASATSSVGTASIF
jgi:hypothetical protein